MWFKLLKIVLALGLVCSALGVDLNRVNRILKQVAETRARILEGSRELLFEDPVCDLEFNLCCGDGCDTLNKTVACATRASICTVRECLGNFNIYEQTLCMVSPETDELTFVDDALIAEMETVLASGNTTLLRETCLEILEDQDMRHVRCMAEFDENDLNSFYTALDTDFPNNEECAPLRSDANGAGSTDNSVNSCDAEARALFSSEQDVVIQFIQACEQEFPTISTQFPTTSYPTRLPTSAATPKPTVAPSSSPSEGPTVNPTSNPTGAPTPKPTNMPSISPTLAPSNAPSVSPTNAPSTSPTLAPTQNPSQSPTKAPTTNTTDVEKTSGASRGCIESTLLMTISLLIMTLPML